MRLAALLSLLLLTPTTVFAHEAKVTAEGMSEEFAIGEAMRQIPKGATVTDTPVSYTHLTLPTTPYV